MNAALEPAYRVLGLQPGKDAGRRGELPLRPPPPAGPDIRARAPDAGSFD
jgi:hypothetical protein